MPSTETFQPYAAPEEQSNSHPSSPEEGIETPETSASEDPIRIVLASLDKNVDAFAREAAHEKHAKKIEGPLWKRTVKSVWHNMIRERQIVGSTQEKRRQILESGDLRVHQGHSDQRWREATIRRYSSDFGEQLVREGETFHNLNSPEAQNDPAAVRIREDLTDLLRRRSMGEFVDEDSFNMGVDRMTETWRDEGVSQDYIGEGLLLAHNLDSVTQQVEAAIDAAVGLGAVDRDAAREEILSKIEIIAGEARVGSNVEIDPTISERIAGKLKNVPFINEGRLSRVTSVVGNELFVASVMSAAIYGAKRGLSVASKVVLPGLGAGIVAAIRERNSLIDERALIGRRADAGVEINPDNASQVELQAAQYESQPASALLDMLGTLYDSQGELNINSRDDLVIAMRLFADVKTRLDVGSREGVRLISYSDASSDEMEDRKFDLELAMAKLEVDINRLFADSARRSSLDIGDEESFVEWSQAEVGVALGMLRGEMRSSDRRFNKIVAKRAFKRAVTAAFFGAAIGYTAKEVAEAAAHVYGSAEQFVEGLFGEGAESDMLTPELVDYSTPLAPDHIGTPVAPDHIGTPIAADHLGTPVAPEHIGDANTPDHIGSPDTSGGAKEATALSGTSKVVVPEGYTVNVSGDSLTITDPNGKTIDGLKLNTDGSLSAESEAALHRAGFGISDKQETVLGKPDVSRHAVPATDFVNSHQDEMTKIHHVKWFDNNTSKFDLNELGTDTFRADNGSVVVDIKSMIGSGSFHGSSGVDWHEAAQDGHLKVYMSASEGTQSRAFEVTINPDGTAVIDQDSPAYGLFDDQGQFKGGFLEIALDGGQSPDGTDNIATLSTVVGGNEGGPVNETVYTPTYQTAHTYTLTQMPDQINTEPLGYETTIATVIPPVVPVTARRKLGEPTVYDAQIEPNNAEAPEPEAAQEPEAPEAPGYEESAAAPEPEAKAAGEGPNEAETNAQGSTPEESVASTGPEVGEPAPQSSEDVQRENDFFDNLDAEPLDTVPGYDFAGYASMGMRERKQAMRFIKQAIREVGSDNRVDVVNRATELASAASSAAHGGMAGLYTKTLGVLSRSADRVARDARKEQARTARNDGEGQQGAGSANDRASKEQQERSGLTAEETRFVDSIAAERRAFPFRVAGADVGGLTSLQIKLATHLLYSAMDRFPRGLGESDWAYYRRIGRTLQSGAAGGAASVGSGAGGSPAMRRIMQGAFTILQNAQYVTPGR